MLRWPRYVMFRIGTSQQARSLFFMESRVLDDERKVTHIEQISERA